MLGDHASLTDMVGMHMCADHPFDRFPVELTIKNRMPQFFCVVGAESRIDHEPTIVVLEKVQVDVGERTPHGHGQPANSLRDFHSGAFCRMFVVRIFEPLTAANFLIYCHIEPRQLRVAKPWEASLPEC